MRATGYLDGEDGWIPLHRRGGSVRAWTVVDRAGFEDLAGFNWSLSKGYASRRTGNSEGGHIEYMARRIVGLQRGDPRVPDHIDRDRLNNRRSNLRIVERAANFQNVPSHVDALSPFRGVSWDKRAGKWHSRAYIDGHHRFLGYFEDEEEAAEVAREFRRQHMPYAVD